MKINLKLEVLKVFLLDFAWETGKKQSAPSGDVCQQEIAAGNPALTDQSQQDTK